GAWHRPATQASTVHLSPSSVQSATVLQPPGGSVVVVVVDGASATTNGERLITSAQASFEPIFAVIVTSLKTPPVLWSIRRFARLMPVPSMSPSLLSSVYLTHTSNGGEAFPGPTTSRNVGSKPCATVV